MFIVAIIILFVEQMLKIGMRNDDGHRDYNTFTGW